MLMLKIKIRRVMQLKQIKYLKKVRNLLDAKFAQSLPEIDSNLSLHSSELINIDPNASNGYTAYISFNVEINIPAEEKLTNISQNPDLWEKVK